MTKTYTHSGGPVWRELTLTVWARYDQNLHSQCEPGMTRNYTRSGSPTWPELTLEVGAWHDQNLHSQWKPGMTRTYTHSGSPVWPELALTVGARYDQNFHSQWEPGMTRTYTHSESPVWTKTYTLIESALWPEYPADSFFHWIVYTIPLEQGMCSVESTDCFTAQIFRSAIHKFTKTSVHDCHIISLPSITDKHGAPGERASINQPPWIVKPICFGLELTWGAHIYNESWRWGGLGTNSHGWEPSALPLTYPIPYCVP